MSECPHVWFPANPIRQKQCVTLYEGALKYMLASPSGAATLVDLYTVFLMVNRHEQLPAYAAQLVFENAYQDATKALDEKYKAAVEKTANGT